MSFLSVSTFKLIFTTQISDRADIVFGDSKKFLMFTIRRINFNKLRIVSHVNLRAEDGATALMMATQAGRLQCVKLLLGFGADVNIEVMIRIF